MDGPLADSSEAHGSPEVLKHPSFDRSRARADPNTPKRFRRLSLAASHLSKEIECGFCGEVTAGPGDDLA